jgi:hypothetical protein
LLYATYKETGSRRRDQFHVCTLRASMNVVI